MNDPGNRRQQSWPPGPPALSSKSFNHLLPPLLGSSLFFADGLDSFQKLCKQGLKQLRRSGPRLIFFSFPLQLLLLSVSFCLSKVSRGGQAQASHGGL